MQNTDKKVWETPSISELSIKSITASGRSVSLNEDSNSKGTFPS